MLQTMMRNQYAVRILALLNCGMACDDARPCATCVQFLFKSVMHMVVHPGSARSSEQLRLRNS